jgi:hypothetical protein
MLEDSRLPLLSLLILLLAIAAPRPVNGGEGDSTDPGVVIRPTAVVDGGGPGQPGGGGRQPEPPPRDGGNPPPTNPGNWIDPGKVDT